MKSSVLFGGVVLLMAIGFGVGWLIGTDSSPPMTTASSSLPDKPRDFIDLSPREERIPDYMAEPNLSPPQRSNTSPQNLTPSEQTSEERQADPVLKASEAEPSIASLSPPSAARDIPHQSPKPMVVIVIDDMGVAKARSSDVVNLPGPLTLAYLPYATQLADQTRTALFAGHELLVHVPMQPTNQDVDPGPNVLTIDLTEEELRRRIHLNLDQFEGYVGLNNHMGSLFTTDATGMSVLMSEVAKRDLFFLDSRTHAQSVAPEMALAHDVPFLVRDVFLDHEKTPDFLAQQLAKTIEIAHKSGRAIAIGHPYTVTIEALAAWLPTLEAQGVQLVPLSVAFPAHS